MMIITKTKLELLAERVYVDTFLHYPDLANTFKINTRKLAHFHKLEEYI